MNNPKQQLSKELEVIKLETAPVVTQASALLIQTPQQYALADSLLSKIVTARKGIKTRLSKILDPLKEALKEMQGLMGEVDNPLATAEITVRERMKGFKMEELRQEQERLRLKQAEEDRLRREARAKEEAAAKAKTDTMKKRLEAQAAELETKADLVDAAPITAPVKVAHSSTRTVKVAVVEDLGAVLQGVLAGEIPEEVVAVDLTRVRAYLKAQPLYVAKWPGIKIVDDIQVVASSR